MNTKKITFIEEGRLSDNEMSNCFGGKRKEVYPNCSAIPGGCGIVAGDNFTVIANCAHNFYTCSSFMQFCSNGTDLATCDGNSPYKQVVKPVAMTC